MSIKMLKQQMLRASLATLIVGEILTDQRTIEVLFSTPYCKIKAEDTCLLPWKTSNGFSLKDNLFFKKKKKKSHPADQMIAMVRI